MKQPNISFHHLFSTSRMTGCTKVRLWAEKEKKVLALDCNKSIEILTDYSFRPPKWKIIGNALVPTLVSSKLFVMICFLLVLNLIYSDNWCLMNYFWLLTLCCSNKIFSYPQRYCVYIYAGSLKVFTVARKRMGGQINTQTVHGRRRLLC